MSKKENLTNFAKAGYQKQGTRQTVNNFLVIITVAFIVHMIPVLLGADSADILLYKIQAYPILKGLNIYSVTHKIFPYSPVSMFIPALCAKISFWLNIPFYIIMKIPAVLGDVFTAGALYLIFSKLDPKNSYFLGLFYALNPLSLLIGSFHGNMMSVPTLFMFLSYVVLLYGVESNYRLSALLLGLAIGFRGFPVLLLPLFLIKLPLPLKKRVEYLIYATIPTALSFVPFLLLDYRSVLKEVFAYSGWADYGFLAILRGILSIKVGILAYGLPGNLQVILTSITKKFFFIMYFIIILGFRKKRLIDLIVAVFLIFYFIYASVASQYFLWILPFIFLTKDRLLKFYLIICSLALIGFYYLYHPQILFGRFDVVKLPLKTLLFNEVVWMTALWLLCGFWILCLIFRKRENEIFI
ncbi:MAG: hypothetical protein HQ549_07035 [Candidatus Omnitrophica bacterium]|nr:hypothetical protein [Candidatus Omnitrophota bacterium]